MVYFDNAATSFPKPKAVREAALLALERYGANPGRSGHALSMACATRVFEVREAAAKMFNSEVEDVVFTQNCTHALNLVIRGVLGRGDHAVISDLEHNSVLRPVHMLAERGVVRYDVATTSEDDDETVAAFRALVRRNTRLICCTHGSNVTGARLPIEKLGALARELDVLFLVDAAQTAGVVDIDIEASGIDFLCVAGHKGLYGPSGTGMLVTPLGGELRPLMAGGTGSYSADFSQPPVMPDRLESGTLNMPGIMGLGAGIGFVARKTPAALFAHEMALAGNIRARLRDTKGVTLYPREHKPGKGLPVIAFNIEGQPSEQVVSALSERGFALRGGLHCAPLCHRKLGTLETGICRISLGAFNTEEQCGRLCDEIRRISRAK